MSEFLLWTIMAAVGFGIMWARRKTSKQWVDAWGERLAALFFLGAGVIVAPGWPSGVVGWVAGLLNQVGGAINDSANQLGTVATVIVALGASVYWLLGLLPNSLFDEPIPDWLTVGGLVLPALAAGIPGPIGEAIRGIHQAISDTMVAATLGALS